VAGHGHDIIAIGASAGGVDAIGDLLEHLPADLAGSVFVVLHRTPARGVDGLVEVLQRRSPLMIVLAREGSAIVHRRVYLIPADAMVELAGGIIHLLRSGDADPSRAGVDALFEAAASAYGERVVAIVLSGALDDGTAGLAEVRRLGGITIVQDPAQALFGDMPQSALDDAPVDFCLPVAEIAAKIGELAAQ
jgi:two-component system, chemotaxis family, protein-glutamate methylesterase/glutaminase